MKTLDTTNLLDQISVIRVQLDELEREIRESLPQPEEKPPVVSMEQVRSIMAEKWSLGKKEELRNLLAQYGVTRLVEVAPENYAKLAEDVEKL